MRFASLLGVLLTGAVSCSSSGGEGSTIGGGTGGATGVGGAGATGGIIGGGGSSATPCASDAMCTGSSFCSVTGVCVSTGNCGADGDCTAPQTCGLGSRQCFDPGGCAADGDCMAGMVCTMGQCEIGGGCGQTVFGIERIKPNMIILLDRSGSMEGDAGGDSRWNVAKNAINTVTASFDDEIRFGLATYSACLPGGCAAGSIVVPITDNNAAAIQGFLSDKIDRGSNDGANVTSQGVEYLCDSGDPETSTGRSLHALVGEPTLQEPGRQNTVLLLTDGNETSQCVTQGQDGPSGAMALLGQTVSVRTFVVGLGLNSATIDSIAMAGGTGASTPANNQTELVNALSAIASSVATCEFAVDAAPPNLDELSVFFNDDPAGIPNDPGNGWSFDTTDNSLTFNGSSCDEIMSGSVNDIDVVFGCPRPVPQ